MINQFEIKGEWFLPSQKDDRVHGTLSFDPKEGANLELYGSLDNDSVIPELKDEEIILGLSSESKQVTLIGCFMSKSGGATLVIGEESGKPSVNYKINYTLIGVHADKTEDLIFDTISSEIFNLGEWVGISGFKHEPHDPEKIKNHEIKVEYKLPDPIHFEIDNETSGSINFIANQPGLSRYQKNINITQRVEFMAKSKVDKSINGLLKYVFGFQNFLILALYRSTYPLTFTLSGEQHKKEYGDGKTYRKEINLYFLVSNIKYKEKPKFDLEMIFDYRRIKVLFPELIKNWFSKYGLLEPAFNLVIEQFHNPNRFNVNTFLNLAQAAETFHARTNNHTRIPKTDYKTMKEEILKLTPSKYHGWLKDQFNFGNNLNLHARLLEICTKYSNEILDKIITDKELFIKQVKYSRNYYTHYSTAGKKKALKGSDLFYLSEKLKIQLVCAFLMEMGFKADDLTKFLDNVKWTLFNHLANWKVEK